MVYPTHLDIHQLCKGNNTDATFHFACMGKEFEGDSDCLKSIIYHQWVIFVFPVNTFACIFVLLKKKSSQKHMIRWRKLNFTNIAICIIFFYQEASSMHVNTHRMSWWSNTELDMKKNYLLSKCYQPQETSLYQPVHYLITEEWNFKN